MFKNKKGFTLIELIVVIAILGILAIIAVPRLGGFTDAARRAADKEAAHVVARSLEMAIASGDLKAPINPAALVLDENGNLTPTGWTNGDGHTYTEPEIEAAIDPLVSLNGRDLQVPASHYDIDVGTNGDVTVQEQSTSTPSGVVTLLAISGVIPPVADATPVTSIPETAQYTGSVSWAPADSHFIAGKTYTATITLTVKSGFTFAGVTANSFTVSGATATNPINSGVVTAVFPAIALPAPSLSFSTTYGETATDLLPKINRPDDTYTFAVVSGDIHIGGPGNSQIHITSRDTSASKTAIFTLTKDSNTWTYTITIPAQNTGTPWYGGYIAPYGAVTIVAN
ncbi:MAG: type II secretion system protein [Candidatus Babeliales bacterium]|jgi:prepilin-type N-terminal cleavage/methylation domain-containing protein